MGNVDGVPVVSQIKSAVQLAQGDAEGAEATQQRFIRQCPVVAQGTSAVQAAMGDLRAAEETQREFVESLPDFDGCHALPVVSQIRSAVQLARGDAEGAEATQQRFIRQCPVVAQGTFAVQAAMGDLCAAEETQREFVANLPATSDALVAAGTSAMLLGAVCGSGTAAAALRRQLALKAMKMWADQALDAILTPASGVGCCRTEHCYLGETLLRTPTPGGYKLVQDLQEGHRFQSASGQDIKVKAIKVHPEQMQLLVRISTSRATLTTTASHRIMVQKSWMEQTAPASSLKKGDRVFCVCSASRERVVEELVDVQRFHSSVETFQVTFDPDEDVEAFLQPCETILNKGHKTTTRRGQQQMPADRLSIPNTDPHGLSD